MRRTLVHRAEKYSSSRVKCANGRDFQWRMTSTWFRTFYDLAVDFFLRFTESWEWLGWLGNGLHLIHIPIQFGIFMNTMESIRKSTKKITGNPMAYIMQSIFIIMMKSFHWFSNQVVYQQIPVYYKHENSHVILRVDKGKYAWKNCKMGWKSDLGVILKR